MNAEQRLTIVNLMEAMRKELACDDGHTQHIIVAYLQLILEHIARYYASQLSMQIQSSSDLLTRFENLLRRYYDEGLQRTHGLPTVKYCAQELFLSTNYFGDAMTKTYSALLETTVSCPCRQCSDGRCSSKAEKP